MKNLISKLVPLLLRKHPHLYKRPHPPETFHSTGCPSSLSCHSPFRSGWFFKSVLTPPNSPAHRTDANTHAKPRPPPLSTLARSFGVGTFLSPFGNTLQFGIPRSQRRLVCRDSIFLPHCKKAEKNRYPPPVVTRSITSNYETFFGESPGTRPTGAKQLP